MTREAGPRNSSDQSSSLEAARLSLARVRTNSVGNLRDLWAQVAPVVTDALRIERIGIWVLIDGGAAARCRYLFQHSSREVFQGSVLQAKDFPAYFRALEERRVIAVEDARVSPLTSELREPYLEPLGITSMLDAAIYSEGHVVGIVCHEHVGPNRQWSGAECDFAVAVADNIARIYQEHLRKNAESSMLAYEAHLAELHRMEAVGRMAAGIAHDFRGILGAAQGYTELALRVRDLPKEADRQLRQALGAIERGTKLIQQVTTFAREETITPRVLEVGSVVETLAGMFRVLLGDKIELQLEIERPTSRVFLDSSQLERALLNVVLNARDAMPDGGTLAIAVRDATVVNEEGDSEVVVAISIADTGVGMDADMLAHIVKPFFTTKGDGGTGLGLAIVERIMARAGGFIRFKSARGHGTTAALYFPRIAASDSP